MNSIEANHVEQADILHKSLFPEEYDYMLDSIADAVERAKGINPMSEAYIEKVNNRRANMGFTAYNVREAENKTYAFVLDMVQKNKASEIVALIRKFGLNSS